MRKRLAKRDDTCRCNEWSIRRLAAQLGFDRDVIKRRLDEAGVVPLGSRAGHSLYRLREAARAIYAGVSKQSRT